MSGCAHDSMSGDEGPILELGRMPTRWRCDECGATVYDPNVSDVGPLDEYRGQ